MSPGTRSVELTEMNSAGKEKGLIEDLNAHIIMHHTCKHTCFAVNFATNKHVSVRSHCITKCLLILQDAYEKKKIEDNDGFNKTKRVILTHPPQIVDIPGQRHG